MLVVVLCLIFSLELNYQSALVLVEFWYHLNSFCIYILAIVREACKPAFFAYIVFPTHALIVFDKP